MRSCLAAAGAMVMLPGCGLFGDGGALHVAVIGEVSANPDPARVSAGSAAAIVLDATARGLVAHDGDGQIEAGLADRWTVIDDGRSYIFRLRDAQWDGRRVTATDAAWSLAQRMRSRDLPLALRGEFDAVDSVRGMTAKVIEIRLSRPLPHFLDLLAHPAMALRRRDSGWGPLRADRVGRALSLTEAPDPVAQAAAEAEGAAPGAAALLWGANAAAAFAQFNSGDTAAVLGGRFEHWPYVAAADVEAQAVRRDPVDGLFGLAVVSNDGFLADNLGRDAVAMAINRVDIGERLGVPQWATRTTLRSGRVPTGQAAANLPEPIFPAWIDLTMAQRRAQARTIVARLVGQDNAPTLRIALPRGPGATILFAQLRRDLGAVGLRVERVNMRSDADLRLVDEVAPSDDPLWYLKRLRCGRGLLCDTDIEPLFDAFDAATEAPARSDLISRIDEAMTRHGGFIPLGLPLRFSLVAPRLSGFRPNSRGQHSILRLLPPRE